MPEPSRIEVTLSERYDLAELGRQWIDLQSRATHSFFTSWGWMRCWLSNLPEQIRPMVLMARRDDHVVGLAVLGRRSQRRRKIVRFDGLFLNETGDEDVDHLTIEHNGILADSSDEIGIHRECVRFLLDESPEWDEVSFSGVDASNVMNSVLSEPPAGVQRRVAKESPCISVNLSKLRESNAEYLSVLSGNTRQQIRRAMRLYEESGTLSVDVASTMTDAAEFFDELKSLHQAYWTAKGQPGAFGSEFCDRFHRTLIADRFPHGEIQLLRIRAGEHVLGMLYHFLYQGRVYCYQSGFTYDNDSRRKPGLVSHALAIRYNQEQGAAVYDFLAGDSQYKSSLGTDTEPMNWIVWQRSRWQFQIEDLLRITRQKIAAFHRGA